MSGRVVLALAPGALRRLTAGKDVVIVSGTNGKTTTTRLIAEMLTEAGRVASNDTGANMPAGLVTAMISEWRFDYAVLEVDERYLRTVCRQTSPKVVVLLNLSRDQLDRNPETAQVARSWREMSHEVRTTVVANCDDPQIYWAASSFPAAIWVAAGTAWPHDSWCCPSCGAALSRVADLGHWSCQGCTLARPRPHWRLGTRSVTFTPEKTTLALKVGLPGRANLANAAMALAAATSLGHAPELMARRLERVRSIAGRYEVVRFLGRRVRLLLAKNPASWGETFETISTSAAVLIVLNARVLDGRDTSWIWDVDFRELRGQAVYISGERRHDLAVRLDVADVEFKIVSSLEEACRLAPLGLLDMVANYTAFLDLVRELRSGRQT